MLIVLVRFSITSSFKKKYFRSLLCFEGDYQLHLSTVHAMHPFFPASGHNNYAKSIQIYLQDMQNLYLSNPDVHKFFSDGNFVTRRSNRYWSGLPDDLVIEQVKSNQKLLYSAMGDHGIEQLALEFSICFESGIKCQKIIFFLL